MQQLSARQLKEWLDDPGRTSPILVDVREPWEFEICHIPGARPIPIRAIAARHYDLSKDADIVVICHHGARSYQVCVLFEQLGFSRICNLLGGMAGWTRDVDPSLPSY